MSGSSLIALLFDLTPFGRKLLSAQVQSQWSREVSNLLKVLQRLVIGHPLILACSTPCWLRGGVTPQGLSLNLGSWPVLRTPRFITTTFTAQRSAGPRLTLYSSTTLDPALGRPKSSSKHGRDLNPHCAVRCSAALARFRPMNSQATNQPLNQFAYRALASCPSNVLDRLGLRCYGEAP